MSQYKNECHILVKILNEIANNGHPRWKTDKDIEHLNRRQLYKHIPMDWELEDYNVLIIRIISSPDSEAYLYYQTGFQKDYFVVGDGDWIAIIGDDGVMETAFPPYSYSDYLDMSKGYIYLGTLKEVLNNEL